MKSIQRFLVWICMATLAAGPAWAGTSDVVQPADDIEFEEVSPGIAKAVLWGDPGIGAYGALMRFDEGQRTPRHAFAADLHIVVVSGILVYDKGDGEVRLEPGSHLKIPAETAHISGAGDEGCLFLVDSKGPYELQMVDDEDSGERI